MNQITGRWIFNRNSGPMIENCEVKAVNWVIFLFNIVLSSLQCSFFLFIEHCFISAAANVLECDIVICEFEL